ncbi:MAG: ferritin-like fold-containing protein [Sporichthyaceae bacterium]
MNTESGAVTTAAEQRAATCELLGLMACAELLAFERLAHDATLAPTLADKAALAGMAAAEYSHYLAVAGRLTELGVDPHEAMAPFAATLTAFHLRTATDTWLQGLLKAFVGDGMAADFYREIAAFLDPATRELVLAVLADTGHSAFAVDRIRAAIAADPRVAGPLALWGRRLVGEVMTNAQQLAAERDALTALIVGGNFDLAEIGRMLARLTDAHTRRMGSLGLQA